MRMQFRQAIPSKNKGRPILARGPQDCMPLKPEEFCAATLYVARAFLSEAYLPKDFFSGVASSSSLSQEGSQRTLLAAYAHFKQDGNRALSFYFRYRALLQLVHSADISKWVTFQQGSEYAVFTEDILGLAARHPLLPSGQFDPASFVSQLDSIDAAARVCVPAPAESSAVRLAGEEADRLVA